MNFEELRSRWTWRPIRHCPGRFVMSGGATELSPAEILASDVQVTEFHVDAARDPVIVIRLVDGGLISYRRKKGTYLHTLNTLEGFERKLAQLGIDV